jgi:type I restriction enzyme M protein
MHGIDDPQVLYTDSLSGKYEEKDTYDIILANPPFKGSLDESDVSSSLLGQLKTKKTELLFLVLALRILDIGGRAAIIVPDGVLFGSSNAHIALRKLIVENNQLEGVISMPSGVFKPYAGVSTAILIFTKGGQTDQVWFYEMESDGYSLDDKRQPIEHSDIPYILKSWRNRFDKDFNSSKQARLAELKNQLEPKKARRLRLNEEINRLTFEDVLNDGNHEEFRKQLNEYKEELNKLNDEIHILQKETNQYTCQFWVSRESIANNKYDLSSSRYREIEQDETFYEKPSITIERMLRIENNIELELKELNEMIINL